MIELKNYGQYSSNNYGSSRSVKIGKLELFFSYKTIVAFKENDNLKISKNIWSKTTGKHLNFINDNKQIRLDHSDFEDELNQVLNKYNLI